MARTWVEPAEGRGGYRLYASREGGYEDPRGVLLTVDQLVVAAGESVRRLRRVQSVSGHLGGDWAGEQSLGEMVAQLDEVRCRLTRLRDEARRAGAATPIDAGDAR